MPTHKEVSKLIDEFILQRERAINSKISTMQEKLYDKVVLEFLYKLRNQEKSGVSNYNLVLEFERNLKKFGLESHPDTLKEYIDAARTLNNMNMMYFSTLIEDQAKLEIIRAMTLKLTEKKLGLNVDGTIKTGGFLDRMISDKWVQRTILKEAKKALDGGFDFQSTRETFKRIIIGGPGDNGLIQKHYTTFTSDLLSSVNNNNNKIYADELGLKHFYYSGGLIKTSRDFCIQRNGKIFTTDQADQWKYDLEIEKMYGAAIDDYDPYTLPGGYGCRHTLNYVTPDLVEGLIRDQNKKASERNEAFKERNKL